MDLGCSSRRPGWGEPQHTAHEGDAPPTGPAQMAPAQTAPTVTAPRPPTAVRTQWMAPILWPMFYLTSTLKHPILTVLSAPQPGCTHLDPSADTPGLERRSSDHSAACSPSLCLKWGPCLLLWIKTHGQKAHGRPGVQRPHLSVSSVWTHTQFDLSDPRTMFARWRSQGLYKCMEEWHTQQWSAWALHPDGRPGWNPWLAQRL